jgi:amino acid adenylation domain-containing protein
MLSIINGNPSPINGPDLLHQLVAPSSTAVAIDFLENGSKRRKFSYKTLHALSDALAQNISRTLGKLENASTIVPVLLPQGPDLYVALLAILKAGRAFCPLGLDTPAERLNFILRDISASLLITTSAHGETLKLDPSQITRLHIDKEPFQEDQNTPLTQSNVQASDLAYVLYTSGSTGQPKAVSVSHRAVTQSLLAHDRHIPHFSRFLQFAAPTFDVSIFEIFFPWYRGCTLASRSRAQMLDNLSETIKLLDVDAAELTPTVVSNLLDGRSSVPCLRLLLTIGEMLTRDVIEEYGDSESRAGILWAMYGPTEAAIHCTLQPRISTDSSTHMIGFPLDTVSAFVVAPLSDSDLPSEFSILPAGEEGELAIGGLQVAEKYLNRPEINARAFIHHPEYGYVYRTGDRAKLCVDGTFECLGRVATGQVKLRGQRIELGEVEQVIMKVDGCRATAVIIIDDNLVAFCATGARQLSQSNVISHCRRWLPDIMIPNDITIMPRLPQLPSGKIDRHSLSTTYRNISQRNGSGTAVPGNGSENPLLELLQQHLKQTLRPETKLSSAGMDSLRAIRLASKLRNGGYPFTALQILSATTVEDLLRAGKGLERSSDLEQETRNDISAPPEDIPDLKPWLANIVCTLPCTPLQEAMLAETTRRSNAYCNWVEVEFSEPYTYDQIRTALEKLAQSNEILRSGFCSAAADQNTFVQVVWKGLASSQVEQVHHFSRTYSLASHDSLLRPWSAQINTHLEKPRLLLRIHHAIYDGWSLDLLLRDLTDMLDGADARHRPQFREVVCFHEAQRRTPQNLSETYWKEVLCDRPEVALPNFNGKIVDGAKTHCLAGRSAVNLHALRGCSEEFMISPQVYFQAAVAFVQSLYLGSSDVVIGNVTSGRTMPITGIEDIIGPCIASLPFRLRFGELARVRDVLQETHRLNRESLKHCALPLRQIAKVANARAGTRLFDILFVWQQALETVPTPSTSARIVDSADQSEVTLTLEFEPRPDHIFFRATFDPSKIPGNQVRYLSRQVDEVVQLFLENPDCATTLIASCFSIELQSIANPTPRQSPLRHGPAYAVERWASNTPSKTALEIFHRVNSTMQVESTTTYAALNSRANQVARMLLEHGVCQGVIVGVIMEKSVNLYVAILAVLKIGAGYLPIVPDLPSERTKTILGEAQVAACITDSSAPSHLRQSTSAEVLDLDKIDLNAYLDDNLKVSYIGANIAYAVFTSGSTGTPKGVLVTQDNLMSNLDYLSTVYPYSKDSRLLQSCSQAFDVSVFEIFFSWHVGICLCTARKEDLFSDLEGAINHLKVTHLSLTPTVAALIDPANVIRVEFLVTAGEAVTEHVRRKWAGRGLYQGEISHGKCAR